MKKLLLIILLFISSTSFAQFYPFYFSLSSPHTWTGTQTFQGLTNADSIKLWRSPYLTLIQPNRLLLAKIDGSDTSTMSILDDVYLHFYDSTSNSYIASFGYGGILLKNSWFNASNSTRILSIGSKFTADSSGKVTTASYKQTSVVVIADSTIDCNLSNTFSKTLGATQRFVFTNFGDGQTVNIAVTNTAGNYTVTWIDPSGLTIKWSASSVPTQTIGAKTDVWTFIRIGTTIYGNVSQNF